jgi:hypothetical protein
LLALALACASQACAIARDVGSDCGDEALCRQAALTSPFDPGSGFSNMSTTQARLPKRDGFVRKLDLLLVINDSPAAEAQQRALAQALPDFIAGLANGDLDGGGAPSFRGVQDLHLGVISGRMNLGNSPASCAESFGSEGELTNVNCLPPNARFASAQSASTVPGAAAALQCMVKLGSAGCYPPQPLESALKALWPSQAAAGGLIFADGSASGPLENAGFLRPDSLLVVIVVSDVDDCSTNRGAELAGLDSAGLLRRCSVRPELRYGLDRYATALRSLRPGASDLVMFFALAGIPRDSVTPALLEETSFDRDEERERFYDELLALPALQPDALGGSGPQGVADGTPPIVCTTPGGPVYPTRRLVELTRAFGANGLVQSLCLEDLGSPLRQILRSIGRRLGPPPL